MGRTAHCLSTFLPSNCFHRRGSRDDWFRRHLPKYGDMYTDWDPANRNEAQQILASITSFEFIVVFMTMYHYLAHLAGITVKLQRATVDIVEAHDMITEVGSSYRKEREDCGTNVSCIYKSKRFIG